MGNLVLYAVENGERRPLISLDPADKLAAAKFTARIANEMRHCEQRGVSLPDFKAVLEEREADESGKVVVKASFTEVEPHTGDTVGKAVTELDKLFAVTPAPAPAVDPVTAKSAKLSR